MTVKESTEQARERRRGELARLSKARLAAMYRSRGYLGSAHPLSSWTKEELVSAVLGTEFPGSAS